MTNKQTLAEFLAYWRVAEDMIEKASREELADVARILALHAAAYAREHGDLPADEHLLVLKPETSRPKRC